MLTKKDIKFLKTLRSAKNRTESGYFLVEGEKSLIEVLNSTWKIDFVLATAKFLNKYPDFKNKGKTRILETPPSILRNAGSLMTNESGVAVVKMPDEMNYSENGNKLVLAAENLQDPGNLGTLIRIADWYGISDIILSPKSVDVFNPKVIQSSMGSFLRIKVHYADLEDIFKVKKIPLFGTFPRGEDVHSALLPSCGYILMGNESQGISQSLIPYIDRKISIPGSGLAESLNVSVAAAVILDNFVRSARSKK
jgi:TrmH family RNA methyltransferase